MWFKTHIILIVIACQVSFSQASVLSNLASSLEGGAWAELQTNGFEDLLQDGPSFITAYADNAVWDPVSRSFLFIGQGHNSNWDNNPSTNSKFICYHEATNTWEVLPDIISPESNIGHAYDHSAIDPVARKFYHRVRGGDKVYTYHIDQKQWSVDLPILLRRGSSLGGYSGLDYIPELNGLLLYDGQYSGLQYWHEGAGQWVKLMDSETSTYQNLMEYNPVHKVTIFGGGNGVRNLYKIDADRNITRLNDAPIGIGITQTVITADQASGKYLVFGDNRRFYEFDVTTDTWTQKYNASTLFDANRDTDDVIGIVAAPVSTHNVIMFLTWDFHRSKVLIYKHSGSLEIQRPLLQKQVFRPAILPNPFTSLLNIQFPGVIRSGQLQVFNSLGQLVGEDKANEVNHLTFMAGGLTNGFYLLKIKADGQSYSKKVLLQR